MHPDFLNIASAGRILVAAVLHLLVALPAAGQDSLLQQQSNIITGVVRCQAPKGEARNLGCRDGLLIAALIEAESETGTQRFQTTTNRRGEYLLEVPPGQYRLRVDDSPWPVAEGTVAAIAPKTSFDLSVGTLPEDWRERWASSAPRIHTSLGFSFKDIQENPVDGVLVVVSDEYQRTWTVRSELRRNDSEAFVSNLPAGRYKIQVYAPPALRATMFDTPPGRPPFENVELSAGEYEYFCLIFKQALSETLTVIAPTVINDGSLGLHFSQRTLETMPLPNGRTMQSLVALVPGIVITESVGTLVQFTAAGQRRLSNRLTIDGVSADLAIDPTALGIGDAGSGALPAFSTLGGTQTLVPFGAIEEVEVRTTNTTAERARTPGAQTTVVTRAGAQKLTASAFADLRPNNLAASDWFVNSGKSPRRRAESFGTGASIGGPLLKNRIFSFASFERQRIDRSVTTTIRVPSQPARENAGPEARSVLDAFPIPNGAELGGGLAEYTGEFPVVSGLSTLSMRIDAPLSGRHRMFGRANWGSSSGDELTSELHLPRLTFRHEEKTLTRTGTFGATSVWENFTHDVRVNVSTHQGSIVASNAPYGGAKPLPIELFAPEGNGTDAWVLLTSFSGPGGVMLSGRTTENGQRQLQVTDTWGFLKGRHEWRFGLDYREVVASTSAAKERYTYSFSGINSLVQGRPRLVMAGSVAPARAILRTGALFLQDTFRLSPRFTLQYGVRYSVKPAPESLNGIEPAIVDFGELPTLKERPQGSRLWDTSWNDVGGQASASYQISQTPGQEATVRASVSVASDELATPGASAFGRAYPFSASVVRPNVFPSSGTPLLPSGSSDFVEYFAFPEKLEPPRTYAWHFGIDQSLGHSQQLSVTYAGTAARDLVYWHAYYVGEREEKIVHAYSNDAEASYHALLARYSKRSSRGLQGTITYALSHAIDTDSGESLTPHASPNTIAPELNRASADFDRRHVLSATASYQLPEASRLPRSVRRLLASWHVDAMVTLQSGAPVTIYADVKHYNLRPDRLPGTNLWIDDPSDPIGRRLNPEAFAVPSEVRHGSLGRNAVRGSTIRQLDLALSRQWRIGKRSLTLRAEAFNVLNVPNFGPPEGDLLDPDFGHPYQSYANALGTGSLMLGGLVPIQQIGGPRAIQFSVRFNW